MKIKYTLMTLLLLYGTAAFSAVAANEQKTKTDTIAQEIKAQTEQAEQYFNDGEYKKSVKLFEKAAEQGDAKSQMMAGLIYYKGLPGVETDFVKAKHWVEKACKQKYKEGYKDSCDLYNGMKLEGPCRLVDTEVWICN